MSINDCFQRISRKTCKYCGVNRFYIEKAHEFLRSGSNVDYHFTHSERYKESIEISTNYQKGNYDKYLENEKSHKYCFHKNNNEKSNHDLSKEIYNKELSNRHEDIIIALLQKISWLRESNDNSFDLLKKKINDKENEINSLKEKQKKLLSDLNRVNCNNFIYADKIKDLENKLLDNDELKNLKEELSKKDKLNKRLVKLLIIYKYHEFNIVEKYDYNEIKQKNKALNTEFKRVAKLMKLC